MGVDLEDVQGLPECPECGGRKWVVVGAAEHGGRAVPLEEPCGICLPRLDRGDKEQGE